MNRPYTIATLGSHSALQILKGAHDEGFHTLAVASRQTERLYRSFAFIDEVMAVDSYSEFPKLVGELERRKVIIVPHGCFIALRAIPTWSAHSRHATTRQPPAHKRRR